MSVVLSEHLPMLASAPDGIQKLRGLILELAVRGKLVPQDPNEEPELTSLAGVGKWAVGSGFPTAEQGTSGAEILFAKVSDMNLPDNGRFIVTTNNTISRETAARLRVNVHPAGTVVFPKIGGAIATNKRRILVRDTAIDNNCLGLTPKPGVLSNWLFVLLSAIDFTEYQAGTSVPALAQGVLAEIPVRLPSVAEQNQIVAKVDELMALCDRLETEQADAASAHARLVETLLGTLTQSPDAADLAANWQRLAEHFDTLFSTEASIDALKQTVLQLAVMGKLVPQDPSDEPASKIFAPDKRLESLLPHEIPRGWTLTGLSNLAEINGGFAFKSTDYTDNGMRVVRISDFDELGFKNHKVVRHPFSQELSRFSLAEDNILMAMTGGTVGKSYLVKVLPEPMIVNQRVATIKVLEGACPTYVDIVIRAEGVQAVIRKAKNSTNDNISMSDIKGFAIPLPPIAEQRRIVAKVDELMALCDNLKADIVTACQHQTTLTDTLIESALEEA